VLSLEVSNSLFTKQPLRMRNPDWTDSENALLVRDYLDMLTLELRGIPFVKTRHTEKMVQEISSRGKRAIEEKRMNVSAVLLKFGLPYVRGYKPHDHYQRESLERAVSEQLVSHTQLSTALEEWMSNIGLKQKFKKDFANSVVDAPQMKPLEKPVVEIPQGIKRDYLREEQRNSRIGEQGEQFVLDFEQWRLSKAGRTDLAKKVIWVSKERGDGFGYDIASKTVNGDDLFIEVKTTTQGIYAPFFFTSNELRFSEQYANQYSLYRVFDLEKRSQMFIQSGYINNFTVSEPVLYKAWIK